MKTLSLAVALTLALCALALGATKPLNYAGTWTLDKAQSKGLPRYYERIKGHKLIVTQDEKQLNVAVEMDLGQAEPDKMSFVYNLNGTESKTETLMRTPAGRMNVPTTLKSTVAENGRVHITITRELQAPDGAEFKAVTTEDWELSADGKTLTVHRTDDTPRGKTQSDMVFVKS